MKGTLCRALALCLLILGLPLCLLAGAEPSVVDPDEARQRAVREDRDPLEGYWGVYHEWYPIPDAARAYNIVIVKNVYGVFKEAKYLGVLYCKRNGCIPGEVRYLFSPLKRKGEFNVTVMTAAGTVSGKALLKKGVVDGKKTDYFDMSSLKMNGNVLVRAMVKLD